MGPVILCCVVVLVLGCIIELIINVVRSAIRKRPQKNPWEDRCTNRVRIVDYYRVIEPSEIREMKAPPFGVSHYLTEEEYRDYLTSVQPLFDEYADTGKIHAIEYESLADVEKYRDEAFFLNHFRKSFLDALNHVNVRRCLDGTYVVVSDGRHRMYVAKKYGLRLLVHVANEECEELSS